MEWCELHKTLMKQPNARGNEETEAVVQRMKPLPLFDTFELGTMIVLGKCCLANQKVAAL